MKKKPINLYLPALIIVTTVLILLVVTLFLPTATSAGTGKGRRISSPGRPGQASGQAGVRQTFGKLTFAP
jgi:hypothetical protein